MVSPVEFLSDKDLRSYHQMRPGFGPPTWLNAGLALFVLLPVALYLAMALVWAWPQMIARTWTGMSILATAAGAAAAGAFWMREVKKFWIYPISEIAGGVAIATQVAAKAEAVVALIGFVGAVRLMLDGMARFRKFRKAYLRAQKVAKT